MVASIGREVAYRRGTGVIVGKRRPTLLPFLLFLVGGAVLFVWGVGVGQRDRQGLVDAQAKVIKVQRSIIHEQNQVMDAQASTITSQAATIRSLKAAKASQVSARASLMVAKPKKPAPERTHSATVVMAARGGWMTGRASWYGPGLYGGTTANGTAFTPKTWCVAHKTLPMGTMVELSYRGRTVRVPVLDRGPFVSGRDFDLSNAVAKELGFDGVQTIRWRVVGR